MNENDFLPFTVLAAVAFGVALVWVLVQWLRADEATESIEADVQRELDRVEKPQAHAARAALPEPDPELDPAIVAEERALSRLLWTWGGLGTGLGMLVGGVAYSFVGALLGGAGGSVLSVIGVVVYASLKIATAEAARRAAAAETEKAQAPLNAPQQVATH